MGRKVARGVQKLLRTLCLGFSVGLLFTVPWRAFGSTAFEKKMSETGHRQVCRVLLIPGAITGEEGGGSGFFIRTGSLFSELKSALRADGHDVVILHLPPDLGVAARGLTLRERVLRLRSSQREKNPDALPEVWLTHSQAGVDARFALKHDATLQRDLRGVMTIASPHEGTDFAAWAARHDVQQGVLGWLLRIFARYDLSVLGFLTDLSPQGLQKGEAKLLNKSDGFSKRFSSALFKCRASGCSWPFRLLAQLSGVRDHGGTAGDGLIRLRSQVFGEPVGEFSLDHLEQVGGETDVFGEQERRRFYDVVRSWLKEKCS